jgi:hypothetical protein
MISHKDFTDQRKIDSYSFHSRIANTLAFSISFKSNLAESFKKTSVISHQIQLVYIREKKGANYENSFKRKSKSQSLQ